jgi:signal transduction histidine kinase
MAAGDLAARAPGGRRDEMGALARQFNTMAESLEAGFRDLRAERDSLKRFVADASHELRTPITALTTFTELLQGSAADDPTARAEFLQESGRQLKRLQWITENLLDLSRLDAGIAALDLASADARDIVRDAVSGHAGRAHEGGVDLSAALSAEQPIVLTCDRQRMLGALSNLVANAVKFTPAGGRVTVAVEEAEGLARFRVSDTGPGIDSQDMPRIFERFYRGKAGAGEGAGLGLAIVKSVAEAHGGSARAESRPGAGSTFLLEVPLAGPRRKA